MADFNPDADARIGVKNDGSINKSPTVAVDGKAITPGYQTVGIGGRFYVVRNAFSNADATILELREAVARHIAQGKPVAKPSKASKDESDG